MASTGVKLSLMGSVLLASGLSTLDGFAAEPPPASKGFQMSHQMGLNFPFGRATGETGDGLGRRYKWQWDLLLIGLGAKVTENWYVGAYVDATFGAKGNDLRVRTACRDRDSNLENDVGCSTSVLRAGLETRYSFSPAGEADYWVGYGLGPVQASQTIHDRVAGRRETTRASGWEYVRLSTGATFRGTQALGIGPYALFSAGQFRRSTTEINDQDVFQGQIENRAFHFWAGVGIRLVLFP